MTYQTELALHIVMEYRHSMSKLTEAHAPHSDDVSYGMCKQANMIYKYNEDVFMKLYRGIPHTLQDGKKTYSIYTILRDIR